MRHSCEKALGIATQLMVAQLQGKGIDNTIQAEQVAEYFLKLTDTLNEHLKAVQDD